MNKIGTMMNHPHLNKKSIEELNKELNNAVRNEDFDLAQKIQEEIKSRNKKID